METVEVRSQIEVTLLTAQVPMTVMAALEYRASDPYAVSVVFFAEPEPVRWLFSRDLLDEGLVHEVGDGDVEVAPSVNEFSDPVVQLRLLSPHGIAIVETRAEAILDFLASSYGLVPLGTESNYLNIDCALDQLLTH